MDRRDTILTVAADYFLDHGYAGTTMSAIAAALGGSKGTLWSYFSSKEELLEAVIDRATTAYRTRLSEILEEPCSDVAQTLRRFCAGILDKVTSPDAVALHRLVVAEAGRFPELGTIFYERGPRQTHVMLAGFLSTAMDRGALRREEPMSAAHTLAALCVSGCHQQLLWGRIESASAEAKAVDVNRAVDLFMRAYATKPAADVAA